MTSFLGKASTVDVQNPDDPDGPMIPGEPRYFIETDGEKVTRDLNDPVSDHLYWLIKETGGDNVVINKATLKTDPRVQSGILEIAITEADNNDVAQAEVRK